MNYGGFILGCITVILILLIVCAFIYPNTIYDSSIILLTAISSIAWVIVYMYTRTLRCIQNDNPKELICKIGGNGRKYKIKGGINTKCYNTITGGIVLNSDQKSIINNLISGINDDNKTNSTNDLNQKISTILEKKCTLNTDNTWSIPLLEYIYPDINTTYTENSNYIFISLKKKLPFDTRNFQLMGFIDNNNNDINVYVKYNSNNSNNSIGNWYSIYHPKRMINDDNMNSIISASQDSRRLISLYRNITQTKLKNGSPPILNSNYDKCHIGILQLLLATNLLDDDDQKQEADAQTTTTTQDKEVQNNEDDDDDIDDDVVYYLSQQQTEKVSEPYVPSKSYGSDKTNFDKFYNNIVNNNLI